LSWVPDPTNMGADARGTNGHFVLGVRSDQVPMQEALTGVGPWLPDAGGTMRH
jgi:hypothetical protein